MEVVVVTGGFPEGFEVSDAFVEGVTSDDLLLSEGLAEDSIEEWVEVCSSAVVEVVLWCVVVLL